MARSFKKIHAALALVLALCTLLLCGCESDRVVAGEEYILAARQAYAALDSARVDVINDATGVSEQIFIYKYDEKGIMTYSYIGRSEDISIAQYNNGYEQFTNENGEYTSLESTDDGFAAYSKDAPYPYASEGLILFYKKAVIDEQSYIAQNEDAIEVCHIYDVSKLDGTGADDSLTSFVVKYYFDGEGNLLFMQEISEMAEPDGAVETHSYSIYITERNEVDSVPNLVENPDDPQIPDLDLDSIV